MNSSRTAGTRDGEAPAMDGNQARPARRRGATYDDQILLWAMLTGLPGSALALALLWWGDYSWALQGTLTVAVVGAWIGAAYALRARVVRPLRTIASLLGGLQEGDYSIRGRTTGGPGSLEDVFREINALVEILREQRLGAVEATALLRTVMAEIDVAVFAFDEHQQIRLVNRAAEKLLKREGEQLLGCTAVEVGLGEYLADAAARTVEQVFPGGIGRWGVRRTTFREQGRPHQLLVLADLSRELREEERQAWQRLVRVLGHELNNSLAPIKSIAGSLQRLIKRLPPSEWQPDTSQGLEIIGARAESLSRFMHAYAQLARLPKPRLKPVELAPLIQRVAALETRLPVAVGDGPRLTVQADADQVEQLLINLIRNAVDAVRETCDPDTSPPSAEAVRIRWVQTGAWLEVQVEDEGPGLSSTANLFVPFFTTKPNGNGIGLVLCRQIAEAHSGSLTLANRTDRRGCVARLRLPAAV